MSVGIYSYDFVCMCVCTYVCMYTCTYACIYRTYVGMYWYVYTRICTYVRTKYVRVTATSKWRIILSTAYQIVSIRTNLQALLNDITSQHPKAMNRFYRGLFPVSGTSEGSSAVRCIWWRSLLKWKSPNYVITFSYLARIYSVPTS
jgi:hypothetical protein